MKRVDFIDHFKNTYADSADRELPFIHFDMLFKEVDNSGIFGLMYMNSKLEDVYTDLNISNGYMLTKDDISFNYDWDYIEENPDGDYCRYTTSLNLNILYDKLVTNHNIVSNDSIVLYRIETSDNKGLYDGIGYNILLNAEEYNHPGPEKDNKFMSIFSHRGPLCNNEYKAKWLFAFADETQIKDWLSNKVVLDLLIENNFKLKKLTVNESNAIIGDSQAIYIGTSVEKVETVPLKSIEHLFVEKKKNKLTI